MAAQYGDIGALGLLLARHQASMRAVEGPGADLDLASALPPDVDHDPAAIVEQHGHATGWGAP